MLVGISDGSVDGAHEDGEDVGILVGLEVGEDEGTLVGLDEGTIVGVGKGALVGGDDETCATYKYIQRARNMNEVRC